jgi:hypothetical protein
MAGDAMPQARQKGERECEKQFAHTGKTTQLTNSATNVAAHPRSPFEQFRRAGAPFDGWFPPSIGPRTFSGNAMNEPHAEAEPKHSNAVVLLRDELPR